MAVCQGVAVYDSLCYREHGDSLDVPDAIAMSPAMSPCSAAQNWPGRLFTPEPPPPSPPLRHCEILIVDCAAFCLSMQNRFHTVCAALQRYSNSRNNYNNKDVV